MATQEYTAAIPPCRKCGQARIDENGEFRCLHCEASQPVIPKEPTPPVNDPGDLEMNRVLAKAGVRVPIVKKDPQAETAKVVAPVVPQVQVCTASFEDQIKLALGILKQLPMPKDIKQFKTINKVIASLEGLTGE